MPLSTFRDETPTLNLTPMIDIVFLLVIFFMVGTKFTEQERNIVLELPSVSQSGALSPAPTRQVVNVYRDGSVTLNKQTVNLDQLIESLRQSTRQYADLGVLIRGDGRGDFQNVAEVLSACRQAGVAELGISVRISNEPIRR